MLLCSRTNDNEHLPWDLNNVYYPLAVRKQFTLIVNVVKIGSRRVKVKMATFRNVKKLKIISKCRDAPDKMAASSNMNPQYYGVIVKL
jgi:hypothetical protein